MLNLTPHAIHLHVGTEVHTFEPSGTVARLTEAWGPTTQGPHGPEVAPPTYGEVLGVPEHGPVLVSALVAQVLAPRRAEVYSPDTGPEGTVRDEVGRIVGTRRLVRWS